jgi:hypothetical protein
VTTVQRTTGAVAPSNAWVLSEGAVDATDDYANCLARHGRTGRWAEFHPSSHLWALQWAETGLCLLPAAGLAGLCVWWIRRNSA